MPKAKRVTKTRREKMSEAKKIPADMDLTNPCQVLSTAVTARPQLSSTHSDEANQASGHPKADRATLVNPSPWISKLTEQQKDSITRALIQPNGQSLRAVAREN